MPLLKKIGYDTICYEPEFFIETVEEEISSLKKLAKKEALFNLKANFLVSAKEMQLRLYQMDTTINEFKAEIKKFLTFKQLNTPSLFRIIDTTPTKECRDELVKEFQRRNYSLNDIIEFFDQLFSYLAATNNCIFHNHAKQFFKKRTEDMALIVHKNFPTAKGIIVIPGYRHPIHKKFAKKELNYLAFFCCTTIKKLHQLSDEDSPEQVLSNKEVNYIMSENSEQNILEILYNTTSLKNALDSENIENDCCSYFTGCRIT